MEEVFCKKCKKLKPITEYYNTKGKFFSPCKVCRRAAQMVQWNSMKEADPEGYRQRNREQYHKYRDYFTKRQKEDTEKLRRLAFAAYCIGEVKCACCGEKEQRFLSLDHINGGGTKERKEGKGGGHFAYRRLKKLGYPAGYQILCYNCNFAKGVWGVCPHINSKA